MFLQPGWLSLFVLIWGIAWSLPRLETLLGRAAILIFLWGGVFANTLYALLSWLTNSWKDTPYGGASGALAMVLGVICRLDRSPIPVQPVYLGKKWSGQWPLWLWVSLYASAESVLNWTVNPVPYRLSTLISFGVAVMAYYSAHNL